MMRAISVTVPGVNGHITYSLDEVMDGDTIYDIEILGNGISSSWLEKRLAAKGMVVKLSVRPAWDNIEDACPKTVFIYLYDVCQISIGSR